MSPATSLTPPPGTRAPEPHPDAPAPGTLLGEHYSGCFGCGEGATNGLHIKARVGEGVSLDAEFEVGEGHQGAPGLAHGGLLTAAFDEVLGALGFLLHKPVVTARLETDFRAPVPVGTVLHIHAWSTGVVGRKLYTKAVGRLGAPDGPVAVEAAALFLSVPMEHFLTNGREEEVRKVMENPGLLEASRVFGVNP